MQREVASSSGKQEAAFFWGPSLSVPCFPTRRWPTPTTEALQPCLPSLPSHTCCAGSGWALAAPALTSMGPLPAGVPQPTAGHKSSGQSLICWSQALPTTWLRTFTITVTFSWAGQGLNSEGANHLRMQPSRISVLSCRKADSQKSALDLSTLRPGFKPRLSLCVAHTPSPPHRGSFSSVK